MLIICIPKLVVSEDLPGAGVVEQVLEHKVVMVTLHER